MKVSKLLRRLLSVVFTLGMVMAFLPGAAITAHAEDGPWVGNVYELHERVNIPHSYIETSPGTVTSLRGSAVLSGIVYDAGNWRFSFSATTAFFIPGDEDKIPDGFRIVSGNGSENDPYKLGLYFEPEPTSLVGTIIKNGESFTFDNAAWIRAYENYNYYCWQGKTLKLTSDPSYDPNNNVWVFGFNGSPSVNTIQIKGDKTKKPGGIEFVSGDGSDNNLYILGLYFEPEPAPTPSPASDEKDEPAPKPEPKQDQTLLTGYIVNGKDAAGNETYANFSQENVWNVVKISSDANSVTYEITPQWETYGTVRIGISAPGFADGPVLVDHYKNGKLIATYSGWVSSGWCEFDNPDGFSRFVIRKPGTSAQTPRRGYVPDTGVR